MEIILINLLFVICVILRMFRIVLCYEYLSHSMHACTHTDEDQAMSCKSFALKNGINKITDNYVLCCCVMCVRLHTHIDEDQAMSCKSFALKSGINKITDNYVVV